MKPDVCPHCGATVPPEAAACPECGSDEKTGWSDEASAQSLDLPDEEFDYEDFVQREFAGGKPKPRGIPWFWWVVAVVLIALFALMFV